jgi:hypothetical protein
MEGVYLALMGIALVAIVAARLWIGHHIRHVDSYYEREYRDPPVFRGPDGGMG